MSRWDSPDSCLLALHEMCNKPLLLAIVLQQTSNSVLCGGGTGNPGPHTWRQVFCQGAALPALVVAFFKTLSVCVCVSVCLFIAQDLAHGYVCTHTGIWVHVCVSIYCWGFNQWICVHTQVYVCVYVPAHARAHVHDQRTTSSLDPCLRWSLLLFSPLAGLGASGNSHLQLPSHLRYPGITDRYWYLILNHTPIPTLGGF